MNKEEFPTETAYVLGIPEQVIAAIGMGGLVLLIVFLGYELWNDNPPDLDKLGLSGIVGLIVGVLVNPQGKCQKRLWYALLIGTGLGAITSAVLLIGFCSDYHAAALVMGVFAAAFFGLLVDGEKWSVGHPAPPTTAKESTADGTSKG
ncbi:hypothetical protein [Kitasatospora sp. NPDC093558]|uniref:hypothetical protein n=1 Tax=Kitasatospora sp. NPDC093558 TaxID=3155201 RepID=UPI003443303C